MFQRTDAAYSATRRSAPVSRRTRLRSRREGGSHGLVNRRPRRCARTVLDISRQVRPWSALTLSEVGEVPACVPQRCGRAHADARIGFIAASQASTISAIEGNHFSLDGRRDCGLRHLADNLRGIPHEHGHHGTREHFRIARIILAVAPNEQAGTLRREAEVSGLRDCEGHQKHSQSRARRRGGAGDHARWWLQAEAGLARQWPQRWRIRSNEVISVATSALP